jgi:hypothetical protein
VRYCSVACQKQDWVEHKKTCKENSVDVGIPQDMYDRLKQSLIAGNREFITDKTGHDEEVILMNGQMYEKTTNRNVIPIDMSQVPKYGQSSSSVVNLSSYPIFISYYGAETMIQSGCNLFTSKEKKEYSIYLTEYDVQLVIFDINIIKPLYSPTNEYLPPAIFATVQDLIRDGYVHKSLMDKVFLFTGSSGVSLTK